MRLREPPMMLLLMEIQGKDKIPAILCTDDPERFAKLASSLQCLSVEINDLFILLQCEFES